MTQVITDNGKLICLDRTFNVNPTYLSPTKFKIGTGTTTPEVSDTDLETPVLIDTGYIKNFVTGYPTLNETTIQSTVRSLLNTVEANGNELTEFGIFNADGSPLMFSRAVFTALTKTTTVEVAFIEKDKIV